MKVKEIRLCDLDISILLVLYDYYSQFQELIWFKFDEMCMVSRNLTFQINRFHQKLFPYKIQANVAY